MHRTRITAFFGFALVGTLSATSCTPGEAPDRLGHPTRQDSAQHAPHRAEFGKGAASVYARYVSADGRRLPTATAFYSELTVGHTAPQSSFMVEGFGHGSIAFQQYDNADDPHRAVVFQLHDPPKGSVEPGDEQAVATYASPLAQVTQRTKGQSGASVRLPLDWQPGTTYRILLLAAADGKYTNYSPYLFFAPPGAKNRSWVKLATVRLATRDSGIFRPYSVVEDTARSTQSAAQLREMRVGNGWIFPADRNWLPLTTAKFSGQARPESPAAYNGGSGSAGFSLSTGGNTVNTVDNGSVLTAQPKTGGPPPDVAALVANPG